MKKILLFITALLLCGTIHAQEYHWTYNYHDYESNFPLIGEVYLNGEVLTSPDIEIAAFVNDQVRCTEFLFEADPVNYPGHYYAWLGVSYDNTGETVTFRIYDHATDTEYTECSTTVLTTADGYGEIWDPLVIEFTVEEPTSYGPEYPWVVNIGFENYMYLETQIQINGVPVTNTNWEVGAFCGDECRGLGDADDWWESPVDQSNILAIVVGGATGDVINFYLYDVESQEVFHGICNETLDWVDDEIGDMFEPFVLNFVTEQTFTKTINAYSGNGGYYLIASPIGAVAPTAVQNMISNNYDLYYFDQAQDLEWINYENPSNEFTQLVPGKGYLYANSQTVQLEFTGYPYNNGNVTLTYSEANPDESMRGWNLVGNPFIVAAYIDNDKPYYRMNEGGTDIMTESSTDSISPMEGVFVKASQNNETLTFSTTAPQKNAALVMNLTHDRGNVIDRAILRFDNGEMLPKFQLNPKSTKVYIPVNNQDYAVANANNDGEMPVSFKAETNGAYTICVSAQEIDFRYLHLIDNLTGADVDLLASPSYTFSALTTDYANRFKLVFVIGSNDDDTFSFYNNGSWFINNDGDAILQVVDVTGRIMSNEEIHGCYSKHIEAAPGVYMLRLINGSNVKVQKIVIE